MTLIEMLENAIKAHPEKAAIICRQRSISYSCLGDIVNKAANALIGFGLKKGDRVGIMAPRSYELVASFLATSKAGGIAMPLNFELPASGVRAVIEATAPRVIFAHGTFIGLLEEAISGISGISIITFGDNAGDYLKWEDIEKNGRADAPRVEVKPEDVFYLNYTSGSTGSSKGAVTTHLNVYWNTLSAADALGLTRDDVHICMFAPFAHPHELFARALFLGGTSVIVNTVYPKSIAEAITENKVTCMMGLAPMYENLLELVEHHKNYDLSSLRVPESGGMFTRQELIERFKNEVGASIVPVWGSTETTGIALANRPGSPQQPGSVGTPCKGYEVKIVDDRNEDTPTGEVGEMIFRGPAVVKGYFEENENKTASFKDGWYYSGDYAKMDGAGNFYFVERKSGMMKIAGLKVYPLEIEQVLLDHPGIKEASVVSVKDRLRGEVPKAIIVLKNGALSPKEVFKFCMEKLPHYKVPRLVEFRETLPKTGSGKTNKKILQMEHA